MSTTARESQRDHGAWSRLQWCTISVHISTGQEHPAILSPGPCEIRFQKFADSKIPKIEYKFR